MVLSRQKQRRGVRLSESESSRISKNDQHARSLHSGRDPVVVAEPIKTTDHPVVVQLKQAAVVAMKPTGERWNSCGGHPTARLGVQARHRADTNCGCTIAENASWLPLTALFGLLALGGASGRRTDAKAH